MQVIRGGLMMLAVLLDSAKTAIPRRFLCLEHIPIAWNRRL
jgi:hypothetical protein